jgi:AAA domain-containing protein/winged helix-turn-helix DNA-binding protein
MKTADDIRRELDGGPNVVVLKVKREPRPEDFIISAVELDAAHFDPVKFVVQGILPVGLAILSAPPKIGKTWMDMSMADAVASGGAFGGCKPVHKGDVLLLDLEGNRRRAQIRFKKLRQGDKAPAGLDIANEWPRMDRGGLDLIRQWAKARQKPRLVIIDIWVKFRPPRPKNADAYQFDYDCVKKLQELAHELGVAIVLVHHNRKAQDADWLNEISGSQGIAGGADTIIIIKRDRAAADAVLHVTGRDVEEQELALKFDKDTGRWSIIGDAAEHRQSETRRRVFGLLSAQGALTPKDIAEELGLKRNAVKQLLLRMLREGAVKGAGGGRYVIA